MNLKFFYRTLQTRPPRHGSHLGHCYQHFRQQRTRLQTAHYGDSGEKMCNLCYERAWYAKLGGCIAIKFLFERMDLRWVFQHQFSFLKALLFVMMDSTGEVSSGAVDMAKSNLEKMLQLCATPLDPDAYQLKEVQDKSLADVIHELVRQVTSPNNFVRDQAMNSLKILADITKTPVTEIMAPHKDVLQDMIPPRYERIKIEKSKTVKMSIFFKYFATFSLIGCF